MKELPIILCDHKGIPEEEMRYSYGVDNETWKHELLDFDWWFAHITESRELL